MKLFLPCNPRSIIRPMISNPQLHGARLVATVLNDPKLTAQWNQYEPPLLPPLSLVPLAQKH